MIKKILLLFLAWKFLNFLFVLLANFIFFEKFDAGFNRFYLEHFPKLLSVWANFDGVSYLQIAEKGYEYPLFVFFPFYSLLIRVFSFISILPRLYLALIISNFSFFLGLLVFYKLLLLEYQEKLALRVIILLLAFPLSFFYGAVYTEGLFFLLSISSFYFARKEKWIWSGVLGFFSSLCRLTGVISLLAYLVEYFFQKKAKLDLKTLFKEKFYFVLLLPLGLFLYGFYLQLNFGDFFLFQKVNEHWQREAFVLPIITIFRYLKILGTLKFEYVYGIALLELVCFLLYFSLSIYTFLKVRASYGIWMLIALLIPIVTGTLQSIPRYGLQLFPVFIALGLIIKPGWKLKIIVIVSIFLQFLLLALFSRGYFVA